jgi:hypothetical protein
MQQRAPILAALVLALFTVFVAAQPPIPLASSVFALGITPWGAPIKT